MQKSIVHVCISKNVYGILLPIKLINTLGYACVYSFKLEVFVHIDLYVYLVASLSYSSTFISFKKRGVESNWKLSNVFRSFSKFLL